MEMESDKEKTLDNEVIVSPIESVKHYNTMDDTKTKVSTLTIPAQEPDGSMNSTQFAINIMKGIAGTGCLGIPSAMLNVGIISGVILFALVAAAYIYAAYQLIKVKDRYKDRFGAISKLIKTNNDYAKICYCTMGISGFYLFDAALLITLYGSCIGCIIVMMDFLMKLPIPIGNESVRRLVLQGVLTVLSIVLCLLKDPSLLVIISSFGLFALIISLCILFGYGVLHNKFVFYDYFLWPKSLEAFLANLGTFVFSLGFLLFFLSQVRYVKRSYYSRIVSTISKSVVLMTIIYIAIGIVFLMLYYDSQEGVKGNILAAIPSDSTASIIISILMVVTCIGSFPLYMSPIHEVYNYDTTTMKSNRLFITKLSYNVFTTVEVICISGIAYAIPNFNKILNFIGGFSSIFVATTLPSLVHYLCMKKELTFGTRLLDCVIIIVSFIVMVVCTIASFKSFISYHVA